ncbi:MAG: methionine gamma-lyase family protein [Clostridiales bacterium]|nr:methionine gamma-lyase family protein [Clostridiales bacterium]
MKFSEIPASLYEQARQAEQELAGVFAHIDEVASKNTQRVLEAFQEERVSDTLFAGTAGYGYDDRGRDTLDRIWARVFGAEAALVRRSFVNGTHAITASLFAAVRPGDTLLSVTGAPYDTLREAIGIQGDAFGSLRFYGVDYAQVELAADGGADLPAIAEAVRRIRPAAVTIQRSRGYGQRRALSSEEIGEICRCVKEISPETVCVCDNCYGEFVGTTEPTMLGADLIAGSLIKNPGGGLAPTGGYVAGRADLVERAAFRLTSPGIGGECGSEEAGYRTLYQGLFLAPHTVAQALKTAAFCAAMLQRFGLESSPGPFEERNDIIQMICFGDGDKLRRFCRGIQHGAPVDSFVTPEPWKMPGYDCEVIMAAGAFVQGASIELSCDGPMKPPYTGYLQGGLTYESGRLGILLALAEMMD